MSERVPYLRQVDDRAPRLELDGDPRAVEVRLMGTAEAIDRLAATVLPGFREAVRKPLDDAPGSVVAYGTVTVGPDLHAYMSTYCQHEYGAAGPTAVGLHALCVAKYGVCGERPHPGSCKVCRSHCLCPQHAHDRPRPDTVDG